MNRWIQHKVLRAKYRKYALRISVIAHFILLIVMALLLLTSEVQELEDEIQVELFTELPRQVVKKKPTPMLKEIPKEEPPKPEMPVPEENIPQRKKITLQKDVNVVKAEQSPVEVAKLPARSQTSVDIQQPSPKRLDIDAAALSETPDLATDAALPASPESVLSPIGETDGSTEHGSQTRRRNSGVRSPGKSAGEGVRKGISETGAGKTIGMKKGSSTGGSGDGSATFSSIIGELTDDIIASSGGLPIDVVFVVDASGSMQDNINAVAEHLGQMVDAYKASEIDYQLGLTHFNMAMGGTSQQNNIHVFQLMRDLSTYKQTLYAIIPTGDENALDAINQTVGQLRFRTNTVKHLILVTDEPFTSLQGHTVHTIIKLCQRNELYVNVLGNDIPNHRRLAKETGGSWHAVPQDSMQNPIVSTSPRPLVNAQQIGNFILTDGANIPVDIILFIDSSKSMTDKVSYLTEQIDLWIRNWDNAMIDYRIGVVRFRAKQSVNIVNVFKPPQTKEQLHSILQLPCQDDENLHQAVIDGVRRIQRRQNVKTHFILITDEPGNPKQPITGTIGYLKELPVVVSVLGAADNFQQQVAAQTGGVYVTIPNRHKQNMLNQ